MHDFRINVELRMRGNKKKKELIIYLGVIVAIDALIGRKGEFKVRNTSFT